MVGAKRFSSLVAQVGGHFLSNIFQLVRGVAVAQLADCNFWREPKADWCEIDFFFAQAIADLLSRFEEGFSRNLLTSCFEQTILHSGTVILYVAPMTGSCTTSLKTTRAPKAL